MNKIYIQNLFIILALLISSLSYTQKKAKDTPKTSKQEVYDVTKAHTESEVIKIISTQLTRATMNKNNRAVVSKATSELMKSVKHMTKDQTKAFLSRLSKMSRANLSKLAQMSPRGLNNFAASAVSKLSKSSKSLTTIIGAAGDKAGNAALQAVSKIDDAIANGGKISKEMIKKLKDAADNLPPGRVKAFLDYLRNKSVTDWKDITDLEGPDKGPGSVVGTFVDGVFVLYDFYDIYYSDDEPEIKNINYATKTAGYIAGTSGGIAAGLAVDATTTVLGGFGPGLLIAWSSVQVANVTNEYLMLQKELKDKKDAQTFERANNRILVMRQFIKVNNKIKAGQINNANSLLIKLEQFLASNNCENEEKLFDLHKGLEEMAKTAARKQLINNVINKARKPHLKALNLYNKGIELHLAKIYAAEALAILNNNLKKYPEIGNLEAIRASKTLINNINKKIANAGALVITNVNAPKQVSPGEDIEIPVSVKGGIPYYSGAGSIYGNTSDKPEVTFNWTAPSKPGIQKFTLQLQDCMGSIASASVSIEVVENIIDDNNEVGEQITDNSPEGLEGCWVGWSVCGTRDIDCPIFQYFFKIQTKSEVRYYAISAWVQIIENKYYITGMDGSAEENISKKKIKGDGWELTKFKYPNIPEIPETSNETYENEIQGIMQELKEAKTSDERNSLQSVIGSINDRINEKIWSRIFYETALEWTNENKWQSFNYQTDESYYNGYADWWVCPDEVIAAFSNALKNKSN